MIDVGSVLSGRFQLRANLGVEGAATVWDAFDTVLDRRVLIRLLRADLATDPAAVERFQGDMRAAARKDSSAGARVLDAGDDPRTRLPFVVFEWVPREPEPSATRGGGVVPPSAPEPSAAAPLWLERPRGPRGRPSQSPRGTRSQNPGGNLPQSPGSRPSQDPGSRPSQDPGGEVPQSPSGKLPQNPGSWPPQAARRVRPQGNRDGRPGRPLQALVLMLILVPVVVGAVLIRNFLQQPAPVPAQLFGSSGGSGAASPAAAAVASTPAAVTATATLTAGRTPPTAQTQAPAQGQAPTEAQAPTQGQRPTQAQAPTQGQAPAPTQAPAARPVPTSAPAVARASPSSSSLYVGGERRRVANTDGQGVALRATAGGDKLPGKGYDEGATVTVLEVRGDYALIRGDDGRQGWVLAVTLVP